MVSLTNFKLVGDSAELASVCYDNPTFDETTTSNNTKDKNNSHYQQQHHRNLNQNQDHNEHQRQNDNTDQNEHHTNINIRYERPEDDDQQQHHHHHHIESSNEEAEETASALTENSEDQRTISESGDQHQAATNITYSDGKTILTLESSSSSSSLQKQQPSPPLQLPLGQQHPLDGFAGLVTDKTRQQQHQQQQGHVEKNGAQQRQFNGGYHHVDASEHHNAMLFDPRHFEIRWQDLNYQVEPKWYQQKWRSFFESSPSPHKTKPQSTNPNSNNPNNPSNNNNNNNNNLNNQNLKASGCITTNQEPLARQQPIRTSILNNLNGTVRSGQVTAILGPSGAGKTSLLGCLTGKHKKGVSGTIQVKGGPDKPLSICTIPQKDYLLNQLTVSENLWYASRLKHPDKNFDHDSNINRVLHLLKLQSCVHTKISKISGGQYKRVSIAQELLSNPDILILDEPTSGLDSLTCYKTVMVLRDLAQLSPNPMAIIVTIHQPQREVFDLFNHVYILAMGGQAIYEGHPSRSIETINKCSGAHLHFDASYNPASYLVEIASAEFGYKPIEALVENQFRQFRQRTQEQDLQQALLSQQQQQASGGQLMLTTPGGHRKKESPIVARIKSTFGLGSSPSNQRKQQQLNQTVYLGMPTINEPTDIDGTTSNTDGTATLEMIPGVGVGGGMISSKGSSSFDGSSLQLMNSGTISSRGDGGSGVGGGGGGGGDGIGGGGTNLGEFYLDDRLQTHKHNHDGHFFRHCNLLTSRSWLCLRKDPMLTTLRFAAHIFVPLLITLVYGNRVGKPNACPLYETDMDLIDYAKRGATRLLGLQDELRCTFENVGLYFLSIYAFTFSTMCLTSLSFPLNMHVLLKEVRNGWYSIPTFFIGKTLADFPLEFILPAVTLLITYPLTGQPSSYLEWRFLAGTIVFVLTSLIAQTQGLIFGALFMNTMQAAVFVAPVSTTPLILLSGFLIRIGQMPHYLQILSSFSYFRYAIEGLTIIRYGFNQCPCDPDVVTGQPVTSSGVPEQLRTMTNYWLSTFNGATDDYNATTTLAGPSGDNEPDFFQDLTVLLARANSFGANITTCEDLKPYPMIDFNLRDEKLYVWMSALVATLIIMKVINYLVVKYSVKFRL